MKKWKRNGRALFGISVPVRVKKLEPPTE